MKGRSTLSDAELIAILLEQGTTTLNAVELAKKVLQHSSNNLHSLAALSVKQLTKIKGIGEAKAVSIIAALELGRRRRDLDMHEKPKVTGSKEVYEILKGDLNDIPHEEFWIILTQPGQSRH